MLCSFLTPRFFVTLRTMSKKQKAKSRSYLSKVIVIVIAIVLCSLAVIVFTKRPENQRVLGASTHQTTFFEGFVSFFERLFGKQQQNPTQQDDSSLFGFMHSGNTETVVGEASGGVDIHAIPLGDGHISSSPKVGYVFSCETNFNGNGAEHAGDWIQGDTWDLTKKIAVQGSVSWDLAYFKSVLNGISRNLSGNGLPVGSTTGIFPIQRSDPASEYDRNPNSIKTQSVNYDIPANPEFAASPSCVPMGAIGYALNGVAIYNAVDDAGRDAVAYIGGDFKPSHEVTEYGFFAQEDLPLLRSNQIILINQALRQRKLQLNRVSTQTVDEVGVVRNIENRPWEGIEHIFKFFNRR